MPDMTETSKNSKQLCEYNDDTTSAAIAPKRNPSGEKNSSNPSN